MGFLDKVIRIKHYYIIAYILINVGCIFSVLTGFTNPFINILSELIILIIFGLMIFDIIVYMPRKFKQKLNLEKIKFVETIITNNYYLTFLKIFFLISITIFPLLLGLRINENPTKISFISQICYGLGLIIFNSSIIKYGYLFPNFQKRSFLNLVYGMIMLVILVNFIYPNIFTKFLTIFSKNFMDIVVISLTFILMTATLALLVFTYNMVLEHRKVKKILKDLGRLYFTATIYIIIVSTISFSFFFLLRIINISDWETALTHNAPLFIELNLICILIFCLSYFIVKFLDTFITVTHICLELLEIDCY